MDESTKIVEDINKRNSELYGPIMACCQKYKKYCRCVKETREYKYYSYKKNM